MDLNRVMLIGRLTRDPELRTTPNGKAVASITVATGRAWTDQAGAKQERTEFSNCVLWGKLAETAGQYLTKGRRVYVDGRVETRDWVGQDGVKRYRTEIVVENMIMLDAPRSAGSMPSSSAPGIAPIMPQPEYVPTISEDAPKDEGIKVEDIPF